VLNFDWKSKMTDFASQPPSKKALPLKGFFQGGMMPATEQNITALIIMDLRSLRLTKEQGEKLEGEMREFLMTRLESMKVDLTDRSAISLSTAVRGIAIE
jgi:hypothetical protein